MFHRSRMIRSAAAAGVAVMMVATGACSSDEDSSGIDVAERSIDAPDADDADMMVPDPDGDLDDLGLADDFDEFDLDDMEMPPIGGGSLPEAWPASVPLPDGLDFHGGNTFDMDNELKVGFRARGSMTLTELDEHFRAMDGWTSDDPVDPDAQVVRLDYESEDGSEELWFMVQRYSTGLDINASYTKYKD